MGKPQQLFFISVGDYLYYFTCIDKLQQCSKICEVYETSTVITA